VVERFTAALLRIGDAHRGERVIVVTHGGALAMGLAQLVGGEYGSWGKVMDNCAVSELVVHPRPELLAFNRTGHLEGI
jgi:broad specificity phosphatase PhoE